MTDYYDGEDDLVRAGDILKARKKGRPQWDGQPVDEPLPEPPPAAGPPRSSGPYGPAVSDPPRSSGPYGPPVPDPPPSTGPYRPPPPAPNRPPPPPPARDLRDGKPPRTFRTLCALMARTQVTRVRVLSLLALDVLAIVSGLAYGNGVRTGMVTQPLEAGAQWIDEFGLGFVVPVATLLFAASMFSDPIDDKTLVYLWLRPVPRGRIVLAAAVTSFVVTWPLVVPAMATTAAVTGGGRDLVVGTVVACTLGVAAYTGVFVALGARVKLPLVWGLLYVIIWEKYVATTSAISKSFALRAYGASVLKAFTRISDSRPKLPLAFLPVAPAIAVPLVISALALVYASRHLARRDVD